MNALIHTLPLAGETFPFAWPAMTMFDVADEIAGGDVNALARIGSSKFRAFVRAAALHGYRTGCLADGVEPDEDRLEYCLRFASVEELMEVAKMGQVESEGDEPAEAGE